MEKMRVLIVDDEPLVREGIPDLLCREPDIEVVGECGDGVWAVAAIKSKSPDLVFLDVQMPEMNGFGVLEALPPEHMPNIIFVTAYDQYAVRAFDFFALDYLLKPFDEDRLYTALRRAKEQFQLQRSSERHQQLLALLREIRDEHSQVDRLIVRSVGRTSFVETDSVDWIEGAGNYLRLHAGKDSHLLRGTMSGIEARLDSKKFIRIHRSAIVNIASIKELRPSCHGEHTLVLKDGTLLTLSRGYHDKLKQLVRRSA